MLVYFGMVIRPVNITCTKLLLFFANSSFFFENSQKYSSLFSFGLAALHSYGILSSLGCNKSLKILKNKKMTKEYWVWSFSCPQRYDNDTIKGSVTYCIQHMILLHKSRVTAFYLYQVWMGFGCLECNLIFQQIFWLLSRLVTTKVKKSG